VQRFDTRYGVPLRPGAGHGHHGEEETGEPEEHGETPVSIDLLQDWIECYNMLAHEEGHLALFAIARDEPLVLNATDPVYASPVRDDPRPIDGIYHTAFVAAREARAHDRLLEWHEQTGALSDSDAKLVSESLEVSVISFWQSFEVLEKFAEYSSLGSAIMDELRDYMSMRFTVLTE